MVYEVVKSSSHGRGVSLLKCLGSEMRNSGSLYRTSSYLQTGVAVKPGHATALSVVDNADDSGAILNANGVVARDVVEVIIVGEVQ